MKRIVVHGWKINFDKVGFTKLLRNEFGYSLSEAKGITDGVLEKKSVTLEMEDYRLQGTASKLEKLRASFDVDAEGS